jgi:hypothetical protein
MTDRFETLPAGPAAISAERAELWRLGGATPWLWGLGSFGWYAASAYLTLPLVTALPAQFLTQPLVWGGVALGGVVVLARLFFGRWLRVSSMAFGLALVGLVLAGLLETSLHAWALERFATFSWRLIGPTAGLFAIIVGCATAGFGVLIAPRGASLPPLLFAVGGALVSGLVVAVNLPGAQGGLDAGSLLPSSLVAAGGAYALGAAFVTVLVAVRRELTDEPVTPA